MSGYAIRLDGLGWRAVDGPEDIMEGEYFSENPPPPPGWDGALIFTRFRTIRETTLNRLAGIGFAALVNEDMATVDAVLSARQALLDLPALPLVTGAIDDATLRTAIINAAQDIIDAAPSGLQDALGNPVASVVFSSL